MVTTRSMTRCRNNGASCCRKRIKICDNGGGVAWSDLNHDVLYLVMMRLGFVEFFSYSGVCKSWRSLALSNRKSFMASRPPMIMHTDEDAWYLEDFEGGEFKTIIPRSVGMGCAGLACGYLIFFCEKTHDIWLMNPITRHELYFPDVPFHVDHSSKTGGVRAVLVFSPSINGWVFVITNRYTSDLWFCIVGKGVWNHVNCGIYHFMDLHAFKGRIYTLHLGGSPIGRRHIRELRFDPVPKLTELETHFLEPSLAVNFISSDENLFLFAYTSRVTHMIHKLRFDDMTWVACEGAEQEYILFNSHLKYSAALKPDSWPASSSGRFFDANKRGEGRIYMSVRWYFPHDCLSAYDIIDL